MKIELINLTIKDISAGYEDKLEQGVSGFGGKLDIRPPYQREFVYDDKQRSAVIDTVNKGFPLNVMYWAVRDDGNFEIIDGQQRTISICQYVNGDFSHNNKYFHNVSFKIGTFPTQNVDYVVMSGTYNLTVIKNIKIWENYIIENLKSNWNYAKKALIFNCLVNQSRKIQKNLYYTELSWIKNICEKNFGNFECIKHNMLPNDITIVLKKLD